MSLNTLYRYEGFEPKLTLQSPAGRAPHALPARPGSRSDNHGTPIRGAANPAPSLASRMGPAMGTASPGPARPRSPLNPPPADQPSGNGGGNSDTPPADLKRPHSGKRALDFSCLRYSGADEIDAPQLVREGSADVKRRKLSREKAKRDDRNGSGGTGRMFDGAMRAANDK